MTEKPSGFHTHHRQLRRSGDERPVNKLYIGTELHTWIHAHPAEARKLGWIVSQYEDPEDVVVVIPDKLPTRKKREKSEEPRKRTQINVKVPKDVLEDGEEILTDLIALARERLAPKMGWSNDVGTYFVLCAVFAEWMMHTGSGPSSGS